MPADTPYGNITPHQRSDGRGGLLAGHKLLHTTDRLVNPPQRARVIGNQRQRVGAVEQLVNGVFVVKQNVTYHAVFDIVRQHLCQLRVLRTKIGGLRHDLRTKQHAALGIGQRVRTR
ncbi:hypothetical protein SRABI106_03371 [Rahnella aquatilis]|nr:hypothetical protein SRABI106_03371 [Rahnella aquatilis]